MLAIGLLVLIGAPLAFGTDTAHTLQWHATAVRTPALDVDTTSSAPKPNPELCATADAPPDCPPRDDDPEGGDCPDAEGCLPNPTSSPPGADDSQTPKPKPVEPPDECGITDPIACITEGIDALFRGLVESALNPLLKFLSDTLLTTPTLEDLPQVGSLWNNSWQILLASYSTLILVGGLIVMGHETLQTSYTAKEIAPRLVVGFLAGFLSLFVADQLIRLANGLSGALLGNGLNADDAGQALRDMVLGAITGGGLALLLLGLALAVMLVALLITYIVRVAFTVTLLIGAPLALMFHALPQTEGIAKWWWKALAGVLTIQVAQSLTLIVALKVFFTSSGWTPFGPKPSGLINLLVALALIYVLLKIPFWIMSASRVGGSRSFLGSMAKGFLAYKTLGLLKGTTAASCGATATRAATATRPVGPRPGGGPRPAAGGPGRGPVGRPTQVPPPGPTGPKRPPKRDRPHTLAASRLAPPIEDTEWGRGRTAHDTRGAHEASSRAANSRYPTPAAPRSTATEPNRHDLVRRAHDAAQNAWRPLSTGASSGAVLAPPIESTPAGRGGPASSTPQPVAPARRAARATNQASDRQPPIARARPRPSYKTPPAHSDTTPPPSPGPVRRVPLDLPGSHNPAPVRPPRPQHRPRGGSS